MILWSQMLEFVVSFSGIKLLKQLPDFILFGLLVSHRGRSRLNPTILPGPLCDSLPCLVILVKRLHFEAHGNDSRRNLPKSRTFDLGVIALQHKRGSTQAKRLMK